MDINTFTVYRFLLHTYLYVILKMKVQWKIKKSPCITVHAYSICMSLKIDIERKCDFYVQTYTALIEILNRHDRHY